MKITHTNALLIIITLTAASIAFIADSMPLGGVLTAISGILCFVPIRRRRDPFTWSNDVAIAVWKLEGGKVKTTQAQAKDVLQGFRHHYQSEGWTNDELVAFMNISHGNKQKHAKG